VHAEDAIRASCDVYFYRLADLLGIDPIAEVGHEFGLGNPTNFGVVGEVPGVMPSSEYHNRVTPGGYTKGMALNTSIGQGDVNVTPLQLAMLYSTIANGGHLYQPQIVERIETAEGELVGEFKPKLVRDVAMTPEQRATLVGGLIGVVNEPGGTGFRARLPDVVVAGKTGTAQVARIGTVRLKTHELSYWMRDNAWFASFAPADAPELVVVVLNEHSGFGGAEAAPTAGAILKKYFELKKTDAEAFGIEYQAPKPPPARPSQPLMPPLSPPVDSKATDLAQLPEMKPAVASTPPPPPPPPDVAAPRPNPAEPIEPPSGEGAD
jgi:penicillin-binding protein 2